MEHDVWLKPHHNGSFRTAAIALPQSFQIYTKRYVFRHMSKIDQSQKQCHDVRLCSQFQTYQSPNHHQQDQSINPSIHRQCFCVQKVEIMDACMENQFVTTIPTNPTINRNHNHYYPNTRPSVTTITQTAAVQSSTGTTVAVNHYHVGSCAVLWRLRLNRISITPVMTTNIVRCSMTLIVKMIGNTTLDSVSRRWVRRVRPPPQHERMSRRQRMTLATGTTHPQW